MQKTMKPGDYLRLVRKEKNLTQEDISNRLKELGSYRAASSVANWEGGGQEIPLEILPDLAKALDLPSALWFYHYAGIFNDIPGASIFRLLMNASVEELELIESIAVVILKNRENTDKQF